MNFRNFVLCILLSTTTACSTTASFPATGEDAITKATDVGRNIFKHFAPLAGGILGSSFCDTIFKNSRLKSELKLGCTLAGAYVGNRLAKHLKDEDRARQAAATHKALASGKSSSWENPETKIKGKARVVSTQTVAKPVKVKVLKGKVKTVPPLDIIGAPYEVIKDMARVRGGPSTDYVIVGELESATPVNVIGKVKEKEWYLISEDGVGSGFVYANLLKEAEPTALVSSNPENVDPSLVEEQQVAQKRICRTIENSIQLADGTVHKETVNACRGPNGWETQAIT